VVILDAVFDYEIKPVYLRSAPLADANDPELNSLVGEMIRLAAKLSSARSPHDHAALQRQMDTTDHGIDARVYHLYCIGDKDIALIEGSAR